MPVEEMVYRPRGVHADLFRTITRAVTPPYAPMPSEILVEGPAGTAKSRNIVEILNWVQETVEGDKPVRGLFLRKTRASLNESVLFTFEEEVLWPGHPVLDGASREHRTKYTYPNGNQIVLGGLDNPLKLYSTQYDWIYINEANELTLDEYERLIRANRNFAMPYQFIISDCNPDIDRHFLNQRPEQPDSPMVRIVTRHRDNPKFFDDAGAETREGEQYMTRLRSLTGLRRKRLYEGQWCAAEGMVYENWNPAVHVIEAGDVDPNDTERPWGRNIEPIEWYLLSQDYGWRDAQVLQLWGVTKDKKMYRLREYYRTKTGLEWWADRSVEWIKMHEAIRMVCDHRPEMIDMVNQRLGWRGGGVAPIAIKANKGPGSIEAGTDLVRELLGDPDNGKPPRMFFVRGGRDPVRDPELVENHLPTCTEDEIPGYIWTEHRDGQAVKNKPDPTCPDHGCFVAGTMVRTPDGEVPIEAICPGDLVCTPNGPEIVVGCGMTMADAEVWALTLEDGRELVGTPDHPVWVNGCGMVRLDAMRYGDTISSWIQPSTQARNTTSGRTDTFGAAQRRGATTSGCIAGSTRTTTARSRRAGMSTTATVTSSTTTRRTWRRFRPTSTQACTTQRLWKRLARLLPIGMARRRGESGTQSTPPTPLRPAFGLSPAISVGSGLSVTACENPGFAAMRAVPPAAEHPAWIRRFASAQDVASRSPSIGTPAPGSVPAGVVGVRRLGRAAVFNLTVEPTHAYFANGVLVSNCDATRYAAMYVWLYDHTPAPRKKKWHPDSNAAWLGHDEVAEW